MGQRMPTPILFAHKGGRAHAPENTLAAFVLALKMGATALESDVWLTADGAPVFDHDGLVGGAPIRELKRSDLPASMTGLEELYGRCGSDFMLSLDILDSDAFEPVLAVARAAGRGAEDRLWLISETVSQAARWRHVEPRVHLVHSTDLAELTVAPAAHAAILREAGIDAINLHEEDWSADLVELFHAEGLLVFGWDAHTLETLRRLIAWGCDAVYGDYVDRLLEVGSLGRPIPGEPASDG